MPIHSNFRRGLLNNLDVPTYFENIDIPALKGKIGEDLIFNALIMHFRTNNILRNFYLRKKSGKLTEIDLLLVTTKGIFVFESKNYSGWVFGNEESRQWTQTFPNGLKFKHYNPIIQNKIHIECLKHNLLKFSNVPYFSIIVFGEDCELINVSVSSNNVYVIKLSETISTIYNILSLHEDVIEESTVNEIIEQLSSLSHSPDEIKKQHLLEIKENSNKCPRCHNPLVERINSSSGNVFYGCKNFPKCRYTKYSTSM